MATARSFFNAYQLLIVSFFFFCFLLISVIFLLSVTVLVALLFHGSVLIFHTFVCSRFLLVDVVLLLLPVFNVFSLACS